MIEGKREDGQDSDKMWRCSSCDATFKPNPPDYSCPKCQSNATVPLDYRDRFERTQKRIMEEKQRKMEPERRCPECGTVMSVGYLVERNPLVELIVLGKEIYWSPDHASEVALNAYACSGCGHVSLHVRKLDADRNSILKAPTRKTTM